MLAVACLAAGALLLGHPGRTRPYRSLTRPPARISLDHWVFRPNPVLRTLRRTTVSAVSRIIDLTPTTVPPARYRYRAAATSRLLPPDAVPDTRLGPDPTGTTDFAAADGLGWIPTEPGGPFDGRTIAWRALTVKDAGVDLECAWDAEVFVDRFLLDPDVLGQVRRVRVLVPVGDRLRQVGQLDLRDRSADEPTLELPGPIGLDVGHPVRSCVVRFETVLTDLVLTGGVTVVGTAMPPVGIFPAPAGAQLTDDLVPVGAFAGAVVRPVGPEAVAVPVAEHLVARVAEAVDQDWRIESPGAWGSSGQGPEGLGALVITCAPGRTGDPDLTSLVDALGVDPAPESFALQVSHDQVVVVGDRRGLRHGAECVVHQLIMDGGVRQGELVDRPAHEFRGVHLPLPGPSQVDHFRRLIRWLVVPARFNTVIVEVAGGMEFRRHPEINRTWQDAHARALAGEMAMPGHFSMVAPGECLSQHDTAALVAELKALDLDVIPEVQSLSHVQYLTLAHPEIAEVAGEVDNTAEVDLFAADQPAGKHPSCYCPSNPASYKLILDVLTEVLDVFQPERHVHLGHDEVYELGVCPTCRHRDPAELFADDVNRLCAVVAERGLRPIIWADMLQPEARYRAAAALDRLPEDLLMMDFIWYFHRERDTEPYLLDHGREVVIGNLYSSHFPRWEQRSTRPGIVGGQVSTWVALDDEAMVREGKYYDIAHVGVMLWSARHHRHHRPGLARRIAPFLTDLRSRLTGAPPASSADGVDLLGPPSEVGTGPDEHPTEPAPPLGRRHGDPLLAALAARLDGPLRVVEPGGRTTGYPLTAPFVLPPSDTTTSAATGLDLELPQGTTEVHLVQAVTRPVPRAAWGPLPEIGRWRALTADNTEVALHSLTVGGTVGHLHSRYAAPLPTSYYRHQGYTGIYRSDPVMVGQLDDGRDLCLYRTVWQLPADGPSATRLALELDADIGCSLLVAAAVAHRG
ncbi:MAG TPA: family 20 glycosylhydrolase [Bacillota bacterium]|nr:family 20 glycosylhydrolase [Bacillota bacterium]